MPKRTSEPSTSFSDQKYARLEEFDKQQADSSTSYQPNYRDPNWDIGRYVEILKNGHQPDAYSKLKFFTEPYTPDEDYTEWPTFERKRGARIVRERLGRTYFDPEKAHNYFSYSVKDKGIYCRACAIFASDKEGPAEASKSDKLIKSPFINFRKFNGGQSQGKTKHEKGTFHLECVQRANSFLNSMAERPGVRIPPPFQQSLVTYQVVDFGGVRFVLP
ncbi:unnamed protein product [Bursaphelenchus okinawaensis]|uniref:TTF-type domain-containing protein n=1 Tax=Bursaphelenchus okinawaensis TaxID=465554 RepID=A0A811KDZ9_9BILA|nr:unnamed protein product [Bursaphelenchus okinawaensis]CAG9101973.1 unnamed protein product [Bursaphelenchus okinawaensis]